VMRTNGERVKAPSWVGVAAITTRREFEQEERGVFVAPM
jgi:hypothetical protein